MLLKSYELELFNNKCMPGAMTIQCFAHLSEDVSAVIPYINSALGGFECIKDPPSVTFRIQGKLLTVHGRKIAVNALKDRDEAIKIVEWIKREINAAWEKREEIEPSFEGLPRINLMEILKLLPRTNCRECGAPTCMVFATQLAEGAKGTSDCPGLSGADGVRLNEYLEPYSIDN